MSGDTETHIVYIEGGTGRPGWCDACLKSSVVSTDVVTLSGDGLSVIAEASECRDCGSGVPPPTP